jgi:hypothetical protein
VKLRVSQFLFNDVVAQFSDFDHKKVDAFTAIPYVTKYDEASNAQGGTPQMRWSQDDSEHRTILTIRAHQD